MRIDFWFYEKYGMNDFKYAKKLMHDKDLTWSEALLQVDALMYEVYQENLYGTEFRSVTEADDVPYII